MNDLNDVLQIIDEYYTRVGEWALKEREKGKTLDDANRIFRESERRHREGLAKLNALKLSRDDRRHFSLLRDGFKLMIKSAQQGQRGKYDKSVISAQKAALLMAKYNVRMTMHVATRGG